VETTTDLQAKVKRLKALLDERNQVDVHAWLVQRAVQRQEEEDSEKMVALLREQQGHFATQLEEAKAAVEARIVVRMREEQDELIAHHMESLQQLNTAYAQELQAARAADQEAAQRHVHQQIQNVTAKLTNEHSRGMLEERAEQGTKLDALSLDVEALHGVMSHDVHYKETSHTAHQLSAAILSIDEVVGGKVHMQQMAAQCRALPALAKKIDDPLLSLVFEATKLEEITMPVPTHAQLCSRFDDVAAAGRCAALVPEGSGLWGYALASVVSSFTFKAEGDKVAHIFSAAEVLLAEGALLPAVAELKKLRGPPAALCAGWVHAAEERLLFEQTIRIAKAQASLVMSAMF